MRICPSHWDKLKAAIESRGLMHLVARDAQTAMQNIVLELEGRAQEAYFDPLMQANCMLMSAALRRGGIEMLMGDLCPVCEGIKWNLAKQAADGPDPNWNGGVAATEADEERYWIDGPSDAVLAIAVAKGLVAIPPEERNDA